MSHHALPPDALDQLFLAAHTHHGWQDRPVSDALLRQVYELARMGPTSFNSNPARIVFVTSPAAKARLQPALSEGNIAQTLAAPATAIIAYDLEFYEHLPTLYPATEARHFYAGKEAAAQTAAFRNGTLQGAYLILAARALGLDCGPMSGFNNAKVDEIFFAGTSWRSNFLCNLGYGDPAKLHPRGPRLDFDTACRIE